MVACSIGRQVLYGRSRPVTAPGKSICGFWPKPTWAEQLPHLARLHLHRQLDGADVAGLLDHLRHRQHAVRVRVA
jgi:hypothetical protein